MSQIHFHKLPKSVLRNHQDKSQAVQNQCLVDTVKRHIEKQVEHPPCVINFEYLASMPPEAQIIYWIWRFECEAGPGGMDVFILQSEGIHAPQIHAALKVIGANELAHRLEAAIPFARENAAEFTLLQDRSWFNQFSLSREFPTLESINEGLVALVDALTDTVAAFIRSNEGVLFEDEQDKGE